MEYANFKISSVLTKLYYTCDAQQEWDSYHLIFETDTTNGNLASALGLKSLKSFVRSYIMPKCIVACTYTHMYSFE